MHTIAQSSNVNFTMSSRMIADLTGKQHKDVMADIRTMCRQLEIQSADFSADYLDSRGRRQPCFELDRYHTEVLITGYDVKRRAAVISRWYELETALRKPQAKPLPGSDAMEFAKLALEHLPKLGEATKQTLLSYASLSAFGERLIPLPKVEQHLMSASELGQKLGISANKVGRLANAHGLKTSEFGEYRLDKSLHSSKTVENFYYKPEAVEQFQRLIA